MTDRDNRLVRTLDAIVMFLGQVSSWVYFAIGLIVTYEVITRYVFNQPTEWVEEMSRLGLVWASFLLLAACLQQSQLITITIITHAVGPRPRLIMEGVALAIIIVTAGIVSWYGLESMLQTIAVGRHSATSLSLPSWIFYLPIIIGFGALAIQGVVELSLLILTGRRRKPTLHHGEI